MPKNCVICQTDKYIKSALRFNGLDIVKCDKCGLYFVNEDFDLSKLSGLYKDDMYENYWKYESGFYEKHWQEMESHTEDIINDLKEESVNVDRYYKRGRLLDLGCFKGHFCKFMRDKGWDTVGVDISKDAIEYGKNEFSLNLYCGDLGGLNLGEDSFDVATLWGVIEHFKEPRSAIRQVYSLLKKEGLLVVKTQSQNSLLTILALFLYRISLGRVKSHLDFFYSREHLFRFSPKNLSLILEDEGFEIKEIKYDSAYVIKFALKSAKPYIRYSLKLMELLAAFLNKRDKMTIYAIKK